MPFGLLNTAGAGGVVDLLPPVNTGADRAAAIARWNMHVDDMIRQDDALWDSPVSPGGGSRNVAGEPSFFEKYGTYIIGGIALVVVAKVVAD